MVPGIVGYGTVRRGGGTSYSRETRMALQINLNADIAEGWGAYDIGNDAALIKIIRSANVACGFHAGDPNTMHRFVMLARKSAAASARIRASTTCGASAAGRSRCAPPTSSTWSPTRSAPCRRMCCYGGLKVTHLKTHGALNNMAAEDEEYALAIGRAIKTVDRDIIYVALAGSKMETAALKLGLRLAREGFADRQYEDDGNLASRSIPGTVLKDPAKAAEQVVRMVRDGEVVSRHGKTIKLKVDTVCVHGDEPTAVEVAGAVRKRLEDEGIEIVPLTQMKLGG